MRCSAGTTRRRDFFYEPDVSLRLDGKLSPDLSYRIFARTQFESFATERLGDAAIARLGARLTQNLYGWRITGQYENRYDFDGVYRDLAFTSNDVMGSVGRDFQFGNVSLSPLALLTYRFSDLAEARRWRFDAVLGIEVKLDPKWSIVSTPFIEAFWFTDGLNSGRQDQIYSVPSRIEVQYGQQRIAHHQRHLRSANLERSLASLTGCANRSETRLRLLNDW